MNDSTELTELRRISSLLAVLAIKDEPRIRQFEILDMAGLSTKEIASLLGISANAASVGLHRSRTRRKK